MALAGALALFVAVMCLLAVLRWQVWSYGTDTGTFAQIAANAWNGFVDGPERGTHFRFHWSPILALLWPVVTLTGTPLALELVQVLLIAACVLPLFAIVKRHAGEAWGVRCAVLALIYPPLISTAFEEFHEVAFFPLIVLVLAWAADARRWRWFAAAAFFAVLIREDVSAELLVIGAGTALVAALRRDRSLAVAAAALAAAAAASLAVYYGIVVPRVGAWRPSHFYQYAFAHGPLQTAFALFTHPVAWSAAMLRAGRLTYLLEAFAPLAFLPLRSRLCWLAVPGFAVVLLANDQNVWRMGNHYALLWAPWLLLAAAAAVCALASRAGERMAMRWWTAAAAVCVLVLIAFDPMHPAHYLAPLPGGRVADVERAFRCVPHNAPVVTHDEWFSHVALQYPHATAFGPWAGGFAGYIVYAKDWKNGYVDRVILPMMKRIRRSGQAVRVCTAGDVVVLLNRPPGTE